MDVEREKFFEVGSFCYQVDIEREDKEIKIKSSEMAPLRPNCPHLGRRVQFSSAHPIIALRCTPSENMGYFTQPPNQSYHCIDMMFCPQQQGSINIFAYVVFGRDQTQQQNNLPEYIVRVITRNQLYGYENPDDYKLTSLPQRHRPLAVSAVSSSCLYCVSSDNGGNAIYAFDYQQDEKTRQWHSTNQEISLSHDKPQERIAARFRKLRCVSYQDQQLKAKQKIVEVMVFEVTSSNHDIRRRSDHFLVGSQEWYKRDDESPASFTRHPSCPLLLNSNYFLKDQKQGLLFSECCPGDAILQNFFVHKYDMNGISSNPQPSPSMIFVVATFSDSSGATTSPRLTLVAFPIEMAPVSHTNSPSNQENDQSHLSELSPRIDSENTHIRFTLVMDNINKLFGDQEELIKQQRTFHSALKILINNPMNDERVDEKNIFHAEISNDGRLLFIASHVVFLVFYLDYRVFARAVLMQKASERNETASTAFRRLPALFNPLRHYYGGGGGSVTSICVLPFDIDFIVNNDSFFDSEESQSLAHATPIARLKALLEVAHSSNMYHGSAFKNRILFFVKKQHETNFHLYNLANNTRDGNKLSGVNSGPLIVSPCGQFICSLPAKDELQQRQHQHHDVAGFELKEFVTHPDLKVGYKPLLTTIFPAHEIAVKTLSYSTRVNANGSKMYSGIHRNVKSKQSIQRAVAADIAKAFSKL